MTWRKHPSDSDLRDLVLGNAIYGAALAGCLTQPSWWLGGFLGGGFIVYFNKKII